MKEQLRTALKDIAGGNAAAAGTAAEQLRQLGRGESGLFDTSCVDDNLFEAARLVYPVYAAYETECNKKEGYPDLLVQIRALRAELEKEDTLENRAAFLDALIHTIDNVSPQLYEYYRELEDLFKDTVRDTVRKYYRGGHFTEESGCAKQESRKGQEAEKLLRAAIAHAAGIHVLLGEKYEMYF